MVAPRPSATSSNAAMSDLPRAVSVAAGMKGFVLWLGGSLAGITALFYACGYLVTTAHLYMLGLYGFVEFDRQYFLLEGAKFLLVVANNLARTLILVSAIALLVIAPLALAARLPVSRRLAQSLLDRFGSEHYADGWHLLRRLLYAALLMLFAALSVGQLATFYEPLTISNLLYSRIAPGHCELIGEGARSARELAAAILCARPQPLREAFSAQLDTAIYLALIACVAWQVVMPWRWRAWLITPFVVGSGVFLLMLPMDFGALMKATRYPVIALASQEPDARWTSARLFLLDRNDSGFTVWNATSRSVLWIPESDVAHAEIVAVQDVFAAPATAPGGRESP